MICISDGHLMTNIDGTDTEVTKNQDDLLVFVKLQLLLQDAQPSEGSELTREIYRWDQRLFSVVLRLPGMGGPSTNPKDPLPSELSLAKLAEATGGKSLMNLQSTN